MAPRTDPTVIDDTTNPSAKTTGVRTLTITGHRGENRTGGEADGEAYGKICLFSSPICSPFNELYGMSGKRRMFYLTSVAG